MSDSFNHLGSIWYQSEPLEVSYFPNQFLGLDFFCRFLQQTGSSRFNFFSDGSVLDTSPTPPSTRGCDILHETSIEIPRSAVTVASPIGNGKKKTPSTTTVSHSARSCGKIQNQLQEVGQNFRPNRDSGVNPGLNKTNKEFISKSKLIQIS